MVIFPVECHGIAGQQSSHKTGKRNLHIPFFNALDNAMLQQTAHI